MHRARSNAGCATRSAPLIAVVMFAGSAWCETASEPFLTPGLYRATRADIVATGRACGNGAPLSPSYVLSVGPPNARHAPGAVAVLRDDGGVVMHLRAGLSQSAALTRTKREFASKGAYTAPVHWAPFVLWGA